MSQNHSHNKKKEQIQIRSETRKHQHLLKLQLYSHLPSQLSPQSWLNYASPSRHVLADDRSRFETIWNLANRAPALNPRDGNKFPAKKMKSSGCSTARKLEKDEFGWNEPSLVNAVWDVNDTFKRSLKEMSYHAISMRVRRRQSDAKWRASVASCYDTLKFIIQDSKKMAKKKISKSLVLEETEKHINNLENALSCLFNQQANETGKAVLWKKGQQWCLASLDELHEDFKEKQSKLFLQTSQGKRRYNLLSEIQEQILDMSVDLSKICILPLTDVKSEKLDEVKHNFSEDGTNQTAENTAFSGRPSQAHGKHSVYGMSETRTKARRVAGLARNSAVLQPMSTLITSRKTPVKDKMIGGFRDEKEFTASLGLNTPMYSKSDRINNIKTEPKGVKKVAKKLTFMTAEEATPAKSEYVDSSLLKSPMTNFGFTPIKLPNESNLGFTPIKLPSEPWLLETANEIVSPLKNTLTDHSLSQVSVNHKMSVSDDGESKNLLCLETFDVLDQEESDLHTQESTPRKQLQNRVRQCGGRRARIQAFKRKLELEKVKSRKKSKSSYVPRCRKQLELDFFCHQDTESALAALEINTDSNSALSPDLLDLDVKPLDFTGFVKKGKADEFKHEWQRVPVMEIKTEESHKLTNQLVPDPYLTSSEERQSGVNIVFNGHGFVEELGDNRCQIVPEIIVKNDVMFSSTRRSPPPASSEEIVLNYI
ncbi:uncharacterized protein LOC121381511 [Gigantopelta aegis]|uniref:uncharacterized protein LOC121381511 n=1 Tax=Gigantopelta aegis TaxID=1735272 RepID=UPI001B889873|nr:uncharacterized protein LOC121381511 [Gigantopelta aegis]